MITRHGRLGNGTCGWTDEVDEDLQLLIFVGLGRWVPLLQRILGFDPGESSDFGLANVAVGFYWRCLMHRQRGRAVLLSPLVDLPVVHGCGDPFFGGR